MSVAEHLLHLGGVARWQELTVVASRSEIRSALREGEIERVSHGRYALPSVADGERAAHAASAPLCLLSAALHHGWAVRRPPAQPQIAVPRGRRASVTGLEVRRLRLHPGDVSGVATTKDRTLIDCLRLLPFGDALAVADSALRDGFSPTRLAALMRDLAGPGAARARHRAALATPDAANPFESALRAIALGVQGLAPRPQTDIYRDKIWLGRVDLADEVLRIVIEADSFEWHGNLAALIRDARRYNAMASAGWLVVRFPGST